jgi:hypothetical protein
MKVTRIVNRGRIAPASPKPVIDSGRTSWSSASPVSSIYTRSPEPQITEQEVAQKSFAHCVFFSIKKCFFLDYNNQLPHHLQRKQ